MSELVLTRARVRVERAERVVEGVRLDTSTGSLVVGVDPDDRLALRLCRLAARVLAVEISAADDPEPWADVTAVWHRVPHTRPVPVAAALALALSGVPTYVQGVPR